MALLKHYITGIKTKHFNIFRNTWVRDTLKQQIITYFGVYAMRSGLDCGADFK